MELDGTVFSISQNAIYVYFVISVCKTVGPHPKFIFGNFGYTLA